MTADPARESGEPDRDAAVTALERLGLSTYEASVFVALQQLGRGTARDIAEVTDVPRSQVYGATERLADRGLVDVQQTTPKQFRPIPLSEAEALLQRRQERDRERAFERLQSIERQEAAAERQEDLWTVTGTASITDRIGTLAADATDELIYGAGAEIHDDRVVQQLSDLAENGVTVGVVSTDDDVIESFAGTPVELIPLPGEYGPDEWPAARLLVVDGRTVLLSVQHAEVPDASGEMAFWSKQTPFAAVLIQLVDGWFGDAIVL